MITYILILVATTSYGGHVVTTQEFNSLETCLYARDYYNKSYTSDHPINANCFKK